MLCVYIFLYRALDEVEVSFMQCSLKLDLPGPSVPPPRPALGWGTGGGDQAKESGANKGDQTSVISCTQQLHHFMGAFVLLSVLRSF
jgi:hypothetical protein